MSRGRCNQWQLNVRVCMQSQMQVMAAELVARAGEVDRLRTDLEAVHAESANLRSEVAQLSQTADETQKKLDSEVSTAKYCCRYV